MQMYLFVIRASSYSLQGTSLRLGMHAMIRPATALCCYHEGAASLYLPLLAFFYRTVS